MLERLSAALPSLPPLLLRLPAEPSSSKITTKPSPNPRVRSLVTLGSPQRPVPSAKGRDMTGGALSWVHSQFPGEVRGQGMCTCTDGSVGFILMFTSPP